MVSKPVVFYTDGCCINNNAKQKQRYGGWAVVDSRGELVLSGYELYTTNNQMELTAILEAITYAGMSKISKIEIRTDSKVAIRVIDVNFSSNLALRELCSNIYNRSRKMHVNFLLTHINRKENPADKFAKMEAKRLRENAKIFSRLE